MSTVYLRPNASEYNSSGYTMRVMRNFGTCQLVHSVQSDHDEVAKNYPGIKHSDLILQVEPAKALACADALWALLAEEAVTVLSTDCAEVSEMLTEPATLMRVARRFKRLNARYRNSLDARGACSAASYAFIGHLRRLQVTNPGITTYYWCHGESAMHEWARVGRINIDWTYRQFDADCAFPRITLDTSVPPIVRPLP